MSKTDYLLNSKLSVHTHSAHSELVGMKSINPEKSEITLKNGRVIGYN